MAIAYDIPRTIGICGAAQSGKDTLCDALIHIITQNSNLFTAQRFSIAGDQIRHDLKELIKTSMYWDINDLYSDQKETIRPLMVEYGRMMRNTTLGRYFIENLTGSIRFQATPVRIIPDIRYDEFPKDERHWLKEEMGGFLIYIERKNTEPANKYEMENLQRLRLWADHIVSWDTLDNLEEGSRFIANQILNQHFLTTSA